MSDILAKARRYYRLAGMLQHSHPVIAHGYLLLADSILDLVKMGRLPVM